MVRQGRAHVLNFMLSLPLSLCHPFISVGGIPNAYFLPRAQGALAASSVSLGHAHLALGSWPIPFVGLERKDRVVLLSDREAKVRRSMAQK